MKKLKVSAETEGKIKARLASWTQKDTDRLIQQIHSDPELQREIELIENCECIGPRDLRMFFSNKPPEPQGEALSPSEDPEY